MTDIADRYERLAAAFVEKVAAVPADGWSAPTPCEEWTARDLVRHVVDAQGMFQGLVGREMGELPSVDDDPEAAVRLATGRTLSDLRDPERAEAEFDGFFGRTSFETAVDRFLSTDLVIHGWDLARAAGLGETIPAEEMARIRSTRRGSATPCAAQGPSVPRSRCPRTPVSRRSSRPSSDARPSDGPVEPAFCQLTTRGRDSGRPHEIEIWFTAVGDSLYLISGGGDRSDWAKNLKAEPAATVRVGDETFPVKGRVPVHPGEERSVAVDRRHAKYADQVSGTLEEWHRDAFIVALDIHEHTR